MIRGVIDQVSLQAGQSLPVAASTDAEVFSFRVLRLLHGDPNPSGPGFLAEEIPCGARNEYRGQVQGIALGSYLRLPAPTVALSGFTFSCWVYPTTPSEADQWIVSWGVPAMAGSIALTISDRRRLLLSLWDERSQVETVEFGRPIFSHRWQFIGFIFDGPTGELAVFQGQRGAEGAGTVRKAITCRSFSPSRDDILIGAYAPVHAIRQRFNGKIGRPLLLLSALDDISIYHLQRGHKPASTDCWAEWDLSQRIESDCLADVSDAKHHGQAVNAPARGVTGPDWAGPHGKTCASAPQEYDAIYLHEGDLDRVDWKSFETITIPAGAKSGIYAAELRTPKGEETWLPFVVRADPAKPAPILYVVPTLTWQAYANRALPDEHETGVSLYTPHCDGSPNYYSTWRKPHGSLSPKACFQPRGVKPGSVVPCCDLVMCSLYTIHWLEHLGVAYDVIADHDLHAAGDQWLHGRKMLLLTGHHEYWTERMLDCVEAYLNSGGRLMNLSGNVMYWVTSIDSARPWLMEVRRFGGTGVGEVDPGEVQHNTTLALGGTWRHRGRSSHHLVGVGFAASGFRDKGAGFARTKASFDPRVRFIFEGISEDEIIGDFGLNQGAAAGVEMDRADVALGTPKDALVLASSRAHAPCFVLAKEDGIGRGPDERVRADMLYFERPSGAKVFSVGSIAWTGSLSHNHYNNNVARISENVLRNFLQ